MPHSTYGCRFLSVLCVPAQGDMTADCVYATACNICSWCQMAREIKRRRQSHTVITAQPVHMVAQQYMMTTQAGAVTSQPAILPVPQGALIPRAM